MPCPGNCTGHGTCYWTSANGLSLAGAADDLDRMGLCEGLSGGETQRLALARVLLRRPKFALLDECTNNCDEAFESWFYERVTRDLGITVLSISHKLSLQAHHPYRLSLDGRGGWDFAKCTSTE